jgi:hypothetical protein
MPCVRQATSPIPKTGFGTPCFPLASYLALFMTGLCLRSHTEAFLFLLAGIALVLLYTGIRNSWDSETYIIVVKRSPARDRDKPSPPTTDSSASS